MIENEIFQYILMIFFQKNFTPTKESIATSQPIMGAIPRAPVVNSDASISSRSGNTTRSVAVPAQYIGARSFRGQKILQPGDLDALFSSKKVDDFF